MNKEKNLNLKPAKKRVSFTNKKQTGGVHSKRGAAAANLTQKKAGSFFRPKTHFL
jgi:hypothetical protein